MALTPEQIDAMAERIVRGAEERMVAELAERLCARLAEGVMGLAEEASLEALARSVRSEAERIVADHADAVSEDVRGNVRDALDGDAEAEWRAFAAVYGAEAAAAAAARFAGGATAHFAELSRQAAEGAAQIIARDNVAMAGHAADEWIRIAGEASDAYVQGLKPLREIMAGAVAEMAGAGISVVDYKSGVSNQPDVAVRRHVVTQASQAGGRMTIERCDVYGHELVITSAHYGARPTHAVWQGKPCAIHGPAEVDGAFYPGLSELTGYGTVGGLKGANCRHMISPYFPGITRLPAREWPEHEKRFGMASGEYYAATQRQRDLERRVRKTKREIAAMESQGVGLESPAYVQKRLVLGRQQKALREHCEKNRLVRQHDREKAYGVERQPRALTGRWASARIAETRGRVTIEIDRFVPCLLDTKTGELMGTSVCRIETRAALKGFNARTGWDINWQKLPKDVEVYGLTLKGDSEIQGLIGIRADKEARGVYLHYLKAAPRNDKRLGGKQDYEGVGGHLLAVAAERSIVEGFGGFLYGFAENKKLERHYIESYGAQHLGMLHPYHFIIDERAAKAILKEYNYEWKR